MGGARLVLGSVTDESLMDQLMEDVEIVYHLAAAFHRNQSDRDYYDVNVKGTEVVTKMAFRHHLKKLIYCSTCGVHDPLKYLPADEGASIQPREYCYQTKYEAEKIVNEYHQKGLNTTILRPASIYGPGDLRHFLMVCKIVSKGIFPIFGDGKTLCHFVYIDNLIDAFILASKIDKGNGQAFAPRLNMDAIDDPLWIVIHGKDLKGSPFELFSSHAILKATFPLYVMKPVHHVSVYYVPKKTSEDRL